MRRHRALIGFWTLAIFVAFSALPAFGQGGTPPPSSPPLFRGGAPKQDKGEDETVRSVQGLVSSSSDQPVEGAVVKLKDTKTLSVRSFITPGDGTYRFHGLNTNVDYQIWADYKDLTSDQKTLSVFDSRRQAVINLKLDKKREQSKD
jgi:hypothetical protein